MTAKCAVSSFTNSFGERGLESSAALNDCTSSTQRPASAIISICRLTGGILERTRTVAPLANRNSATPGSDPARNLLDHSGAGVVNRQTPPRTSKQLISRQKLGSLYGSPS